MVVGYSSWKGLDMTAVSVEDCYYHHIERRDVRVTYRGKHIVAIEPCLEGRLWRIYYNDTDSAVIARAAVVTIEVIQRGTSHVTR
jgi:hypothetical protein